MIKIKYSQLSDMRFVMAMQKIAGTPLNTPTAFTIKKIVQALDTARENMVAEYHEQVVGVYAERDEDNSVIFEDAQKTKFKVLEGKQEELAKAQEAFGAKEIEVPATKINIDNLNVSLSAADLINLEPIYFHLEPVLATPEASSVKELHPTH